MLFILTAISAHGGEASEHSGIGPDLSLLDAPEVRRLTPHSPICNPCSLASSSQVYGHVKWQLGHRPQLKVMEVVHYWVGDL